MKIGDYILCNVNIKMPFLGIKSAILKQFIIQEYFILSLAQYYGLIIENIFGWCNSQLSIAFAITGSQNISLYLLKLLLVVMIVGCFSYRILISWKNKFALFEPK